MAWGLTIHKSQGMTLSKASITIGITNCQGLTFTTISRVKALVDLQIFPTFPFSHYSRMQNNTYVNRIKQEEALLASKSLQSDTL